MTATPLPSAAGVRRVAGNALFLLLAYVFPRGITFAAIVVAARVLGAEEFGYYGTAGAYAVILAILATLGMMPLLIREMAQRPERAPDLVRAAHLAKAATSLIMLAALVLLAVFVLEYPGPVAAAATLLGTAYAIGGFGENLGAYFQARERMDVWFRATAIYGLVTGSVGVVLVLTTSNVVFFCAAPVVGQLAAFLSLVSAMRRAPGVASALPLRGEVTKLLRSLLPFAASFVALTVFYKLDVLLLTRLRESAQVGFYTAAYKFADITVALAIVAAGAVYPRLSRAAAQATGRGAWGAARLTELALLIAVPIAAVLWLTRHQVVQLLFGAEYAATATALGFIAAALPAVTVNIFAGYLLAAFGRMSWTAVVYGIGLIAKIALNWLWIPGYGAAGAARAMLSAEWLVTAGFAAALALAVGAMPGVRALATVAAAAAGAAAVAQVADTVGVVAAAGLYGALVLSLYWVAAAVTPEERQLLRRAFVELRSRGIAPHRA